MVPPHWHLLDGPFEHCLWDTHHMLLQHKEAHSEHHTPESVFALIRTLFGPHGRNASGDSLGDFLGIQGPEGLGDSCEARVA